MKVELCQVTKYFSGSGPGALRGVNLTAEAGQITSLVGASGCGKTTTLRCIAGLESIDGGEIRFDTDVVSSATGAFVPTAKRNVGMVFQSYALWPHLTVAENVAFGLRTRGVGKARIAERVRQILSLMNLSEYGARYPAQLSGGQQQRVALGRALAYEPQVLLLDEPLANLDTHLRGQMRQEIRRLQQETGITMIYVTHDRLEAMELSDRVVILDAGYPVQIGAPSELFDQPANILVARFVGHTNFLQATVRQIDNGRAIVETSLGNCTIDCDSTQATEFALLIGSDALQLAGTKESPPDGWLSGSSRLLSKNTAPGGVQCVFASGEVTLELFISHDAAAKVSENSLIHIDPSKCRLLPGSVGHG